MTWALVNQLDYTASTPGGNISSSGAGGPNNTVALTAGNVAVGWLFNQSAAPTLTDSLGGNSYVHRGSLLAAGTYLHVFTGTIAESGTASFKASSATTNSSILVRQYSGVTSAVPAAIVGNYQNGFPTTTDGIVCPATASPLDVTTAPALMVAFSVLEAATAPLTEGTILTYADFANVWLQGATQPAGVEDYNVASAGDVQISFGCTVSKQAYTLAIVLPLTAIAATDVPSGLSLLGCG
jgi:hypothetical protein